MANLCWQNLVKALSHLVVFLELQSHLESERQASDHFHDPAFHRI